MKTFSFFSFYLFFLVSHLIAAEAVEPTMTIHIPMRDGVELPTDLYFPSPEARDLPCILLRSPAGRRQDFFLSITEMAKAGYLVAIQETRSALDPDGKSIPFISDGWGKLRDGYDTVEWLAASPYTNGKIGTWGISALGITELLMAPSQPPHLACQYVVVAAASLYHHGLFPGGQLLKNQAERWLGCYARDTGVLSYICQKPHYNEFWRQFDTLSVANQVKVPGMHIGGWYDTFLEGTLTAFTSRQYEGGEGAKGKQKLVIGPWTHFWPLSKKLGDFDVPYTGYQPPYDISSKRWFDFYLKGIKDDVEELPNVIYYVMGPFDGTPSSGNVWRTSDIWPIPAKETLFYLHPDLKLQTSMAKPASLSFNYDPRDVIETIGGRNLFLESGPKDQSKIESREDVLVFTSEVLPEDLEVTGPLSAVMYFSSDQLDTDLILRLCDVYPDGRSILISEGVYRLGVMQHDKNRSNKVEDYSEPKEISIDLLATSLVFAKGHALRLSVSSSNFPRYEKNRNIGLIGANTGKFKIAKNTIHMSSKYPSRLVLPVVHREKKEGE